MAWMAAAMRSTKARIGRGRAETKPKTLGSDAPAVRSRARWIISRDSSTIRSGSVRAASKKASRGRARISLSRRATTVAVCGVPASMAISPTGSPALTTPNMCGG